MVASPPPPVPTSPEMSESFLRGGGGPVRRHSTQLTPPLPPSRAPLGGLPAARQPDTTSFQERVQTVFDDFDVRDCGVIEKEGFIVGLRRLRLDLTEATMSDLYGKLAAGTSDGYLRLGDFERFGALYPTLINSLAFRVKDYWMNRKQRDVIDSEVKVLQGLQAAKADACGEHDKLREKLCGHDEEYNRLLQKQADTANRQAKARSQLQNSHRDVDHVQDKLRRLAAQLEEDRARENEAMEALGLLDLKCDVDAARERAEAAEEDVKKAEDHLHQLEKLLSELRDEIDTRRAIAAEMRAEEERAKDRYESSSLGARSVMDAVARGERELAECEAELKRLQAGEEAAGKAFQEVHSAASALASQEQQLKDQLNRLRDETSRRQADVSSANKAVEQQTARVMELQAANEEFNRLCHEQYEDEQEVITQEIRLREQRECLELKEAKLRDEAKRAVPQAITAYPLAPDRSIIFTSPHNREKTASTRIVATSCVPPEHSPSKPDPLPGREYADERRSRTCSDHAGRGEV